MVDKAKLVVWWNDLENQLLERDPRQVDTKATVQGQYDHGRNGKVVPDIAGHVKNRRRKKADR